MQKVGNLVDKKIILHRIVKRSANQKPLYCTFELAKLRDFSSSVVGERKSAMELLSSTS